MAEQHSEDELHDKSDEHDNRFLTKNVEVYDELLERYKTSSFCEQILDQLLKDINESIGEQLSSGKVGPDDYDKFQNTRLTLLKGVSLTALEWTKHYEIIKRRAQVMFDELIPT